MSTAARPPLLYRILGLRRHAGARIPFRLTLRGWVQLLLVVWVVGGAMFAEYSMQPDFCRSCHLMEPYYQAWHSSSHKNVSCVDCHFEPGWGKTLYGKWQASSQAAKFITGTYGSKPHAEVRDSSCLRSGCHEKRLLEGKVEWSVPTQRGLEVKIHFDHAPHLGDLRRGKQLRCVSCHSQIVQGQHIVVTLDTCFICHFKGMKRGRNEEVVGGCGSCHGAPKGTIRLATGDYDHASFLERGVTCENCHAEAIRGDGDVPKQQCWSCHNQPWQIERYGDSSFIHKTHVTDHKVECAHCHIQIQHSLNASINLVSRSTTAIPENAAAVPNAQPPADAHQVPQTSPTTPPSTPPSAPSPFSMQSQLAAAGSAAAVNCSLCHEATHSGPSMLYRGTGGRGLPDMPSPMFAAQVDCLACHQQRENTAEVAEVLGQTYLAAQQRCDYCHGQRYSDQLDSWKKTISEKLGETESAASLAEQALKDAVMPAETALQARRLLDDAQHNLRLVKLGHGVHNVTYATALLSVAVDYSHQVLDLIDPPSAKPNQP
ncbi:MAG: NapC/NirT family cytochrome c [Phycisphaeraceae bacterium]|nr:NapC/NirT family cytochrome c [Phycisphaeraceae bacterium]